MAEDTPVLEVLHKIESRLASLETLVLQVASNQKKMAAGGFLDNSQQLPVSLEEHKHLVVLSSKINKTIETWWRERGPSSGGCLHFDPDQDRIVPPCELCAVKRQLTCYRKARGLVAQAELLRQFPMTKKKLETMRHHQLCRCVGLVGGNPFGLEDRSKKGRMAAVLKAQEAGFDPQAALESLE